jgi:hypothetical protein
MNWYELTIIIHVVGAALGVGGATSSDWLFLHAIRDRVVTREQYNSLHRVSFVVMAGLATVVLSGVAIVLQNREVFAYPSFLAKMVFILLLILNGFIFHAYLMSFLKKHRDQRLTNESLANRLWLFAAAGGVSVVSWFGALLIGVMDPLTLSLWILLGLYLAAILGAAVFAYLLLSHLIFTPMIQIDTPEVLSDLEKKAQGEGRMSGSNLFLTALLVLFLGGLALAYALA